MQSNEKKVKEALSSGGRLVLPRPVSRKRAHWRVARLAVEMAQAQYEEFAKDNDWYKLYPNRKWWVRRAVPFYTEPARATLAGMLAGPYPEDLKREIFECLVIDNQFRGSAYANEQIPN